MSLTRRRLLAGTTGLLVAGALGQWLPAFARAPSASAITVPASFVSLSQKLTGREQPDALLAQRLYSWLHQQVAGLDEQLDSLTNLLNSQPAAQGESWLVTLAKQPAAVQELYQTLISGWYLGVVNSQKPECVAFENIVSYRVVQTSLLPPSYAPGEANFWTQPPGKESNAHG
ncbi:sugar dehydrogenase complex small subunit [Erwinia sp.]|uniref:sugar dehydrogenase complex small subunit n=1 Tax=Erwinia citreus TaxID=558 RepID=UPI003C70C900